MAEYFEGREGERSIRDVAIASSYLVLRATELGLGTCYIGWFDEQGLKTTLRVNNDYVIPFVILLGYPAESPVQTPRKDMTEMLFFK